MHVLGKWKPLVPSGLAVINEDAEILFKPLVHSFGLAVSLGVVGGAYVLLDIEDAAKFLDRKSTRLNSSHYSRSRIPSSA